MHVVACSNLRRPNTLENLFGRKLHDPQLVKMRAPVICTLVIFFYGWGSMHAEIIYVNGADHLREYTNIDFGLISGSFTLGRICKERNKKCWTSSMWDFLFGLQLEKHNPLRIEEKTLELFSRKITDQLVTRLVRLILLKWAELNAQISARLYGLGLFKETRVK